MIKHIAFIDRLVGRSSEKKLYGDMYFTFQESADTRTEDISELIKGSAEYSFGDAAVLGDDTYDEDDNGSFSIYEIYESDIELDDEDYPLWSGTLVGDSKLIEVHVCATREQAGWVEEEETYKGVTIRYREA